MYVFHQYCFLNSVGNEYRCYVISNKQAKEIIGKGAEVVEAGADLLKVEYQKFRDGKYDKALDNIGDLLSNLKDKGGELVGEIDDWQQRKDAWDIKKNDLEELLDSDSDIVDEEKTKKALEDLEKEGKTLEVKRRDTI